MGFYTHSVSLFPQSEIDKFFLNSASDKARNRISLAEPSQNK